MVLKYMVADTDLVNSPQAQSPTKSPPAKKIKPSPPKKPKPSPVKKNAPASMGKLKLSLLVLVNVALLAYAYNRWAPESFWRPGKGSAGSGKIIPSLGFFANSKVKVTGIMHYDENPAALVSGKVVYEGDVVEGCRVVKIHEDKVEFQKNGSYFTKKIIK
ncbi:MAG: hypothetical protein ACYTE5_01335 [Planctomycetota bacterium]|jgi:hypothetical protein